MNISKWCSGIVFVLMLPLLTGSILAKASRVNAQSTNIPFSGSVDTNCTFTTQQTGVLGLSEDGKTFDSRNQGGRTAKLTLSCNRNGVQLKAYKPEQVLPNNLSLSDPPYNASVSATIVYKTGGPGNSQKTFEETLVVDENNPSDTTTKGGKGNARGTNGENEITVNMSVTADKPIPGGSYSYRVRLTAVEN